jgi:hypothetical protein
MKTKKDVKGLIKALAHKTAPEIYFPYQVASA